MLRLSRILKDYQDAGTVIGLISLWGFVDDRVFLTKAGALGVAFKLSPPDGECLDRTARVASAARIAQALRQLGDDYRLYVYLLKRPVTPPSPAAHANPILRAALDERARFISSSAHSFSTCEHYFVLRHEGFARRHKWLANPWHLSSQAHQTYLAHQLDSAAAALRHQAAAFAVVLADVLRPEPLDKDGVFRFVRRLCNYVTWKADAGDTVARTVLAVLRTGHPVQHWLTIPEGLTSPQIAALLADHPSLTRRA